MTPSHTIANSNNNTRQPFDFKQAVAVQNRLSQSKGSSNHIRGDDGQPVACGRGRIPYRLPRNKVRKAQCESEESEDDDEEEDDAQAKEDGEFLYGGDDEEEWFDRREDEEEEDDDEMDVDGEVSLASD